MHSNSKVGETMTVFCNKKEVMNESFEIVSHKKKTYIQYFSDWNLHFTGCSVWKIIKKNQLKNVNRFLKIEKHATSQTDFGYINMRSNMHSFWDTAFHFCNVSNRTPCKSAKRGTCSKVKRSKRKSIGFVFALFAKKSWWGVKWKWFVARAKLVWPVSSLCDGWKIDIPLV